MARMLDENDEEGRNNFVNPGDSDLECSTFELA